MREKEKVLKLVEVLDGKKAKDIVALKVAELTVITDYFVIATGTGATQVKALAGEAAEKMSQTGCPPLRVEGLNSATWALMDFGGVMLHIFDAKTREFYGLEGLWSDAQRVDISEVVKE